MSPSSPSRWPNLVMASPTPPEYPLLLSMIPPTLCTSPSNKPSIITRTLRFSPSQRNYAFFLLKSPAQPFSCS